MSKITPQIIGFMGAPGVGKTTLAQRLSQQEGIYFFQREIVLNCIFGDERNTDHYNSHAGAITKSTFDLGIYNAQNGISSIVEGPMTPAIQGQRTGFIDSTLEAAAQGNFGVSLIYCVAPARIVWDRLHQRGEARDVQKYDLENKETGWPWFLKTFIDVSGPTQYEHLRVDTSQPVDENLVKIVHYIQNRRF